MSKRPIINIKTRIRKKRQLVIIELNNNEFVVLMPNNIKQNTSLEVYELELLIGSNLRVDFYAQHELMFNGKVCKKNNCIVKEYYFELIMPIDKLRIEYRTRLLPYKKIKELFYFHKFSKDNVGIKTEDGSVTYINLKRLEMQSNLDKTEQHILIGSYINPEYYKIGMTLSNGKAVTENNKLLNSLNLRYSNKIEEMHKNFENAVGYYDGEEFYESSDEGPSAYGYGSWSEMAFNEAFEGDNDAWNHYNQ